MSSSRDDKPFEQCKEIAEMYYKIAKLQCPRVPNTSGGTKTFNVVFDKHLGHFTHTEKTTNPGNFDAHFKCDEARTTAINELNKCISMKR